MRITYPFVSVFLVSILLLENLGVQFGRDMSLLLIILSAPLFFAGILITKRKIVAPKNASIFFVIFLIMSFISSIFSVDIQASMRYSLYLIALFLVFLYSYNHRKLIEKPITILIFSTALFLSLYSLLLLTPFFSFLTPVNAYQFVFPRIYSHSHLADFLVLPTVISIYCLYARRNIALAIGSILFTVPFILFSFSSSAYFSLTITSLAIHFYFLIKKHSSKYRIVARLLILGLVLSSVFYLLTVSRQAKNQPILAKTHDLLVQNKGLNKYKDVLGYRFNYFNQAFLSIQQNFLIGIGPDNFSHASKKYTENRLESSMAAHNIFLEVLVGQGFLGFIPFLGLIILFLIKSRKSALYFAFLGALINFQTDYTYQIYSFLLLFFVVAGLLATGKEIELSIPFKRLKRG